MNVNLLHSNGSWASSCLKKTASIIVGLLHEHLKSFRVSDYNASILLNLTSRYRQIFPEFRNGAYCWDAQELRTNEWYTGCLVELTWNVTTSLYFLWSPCILLKICVDSLDSICTVHIFSIPYITTDNNCRHYYNIHNYTVSR